MSKRKQDRLEEFFKGHLENFEEDPGMDLFAGIAANTPPRPPRVDKKRLSGWLFPLSFLFLLLAIGFSWYQYQNVKGLTKQVDVQNDKIEGLKKQLKAIEEIKKLNVPATPQKAKVNALDQEPPIQASNEVKSRTQPVASLAKASTNKQQSKGIIIPGNQRIGSGQLLDKLQESNLDLDKEGLAAEGQQMNRQGNATNQEMLLSAAPLDLISGIAPGLLESRFGEESIDPIESPKQKAKGWYQGVYYEYLRTAVSELANVSLTTSSRPTYSQRFGLLAGKHLNQHWSLQTGIGLNRLTLNFRGSADLNYKYAVPNEVGVSSNTYALNENGDPIFDFLDQEVILANQLQNDGDDLEDGEPFALSIDQGAYQLNYLSIPLWINYRAGSGRLQFTAKAGLVYNYLINDKLGQFDVTINGDRIAFNRLRYVNSMINIASQKKGFLETNLGLGATYNLNKKLQLALLSSYYYTMSPIFNNNTGAIGLSTNVYYQF